jgi:hypothetical protein
VPLKPVEYKKEGDTGQSNGYRAPNSRLTITQVSVAGVKAALEGFTFIAQGSRRASRDLMGAAGASHFVGIGIYYFKAVLFLGKARLFMERLGSTIGITSLIIHITSETLETQSFVYETNNEEGNARESKARLHFESLQTRDTLSLNCN